MTKRKKAEPEDEGSDGVCEEHDGPKLTTKEAKKLKKKNDAWTKIVSKLNLDLSSPISPIIPSTIFREEADIEARLACYNDCLSEVPPVLRASGVFPLPVRNKEYCLIKANGFHEFEEISTPIITYTSRIPFLPDTFDGEGESNYVHYAYNAGLISEFTGKKDIIKMNEGRFRATKFDFNIGSVGPIEQEGVQVQVDGLFEGRDSIIVLEAKVKSNSNFLIRQLYYPWRHWTEKSQKEVIASFLRIDKVSEVYNLWQYRFTDKSNYASIELVKTARYEIVENPYSPEEIEELSLDDVGYVPQADSVDKILQLVSLVGNGHQSAEAISKEMGFVGRQASYYGEAAEELGFITRSREASGAYLFELTPRGMEFYGSRPDIRKGMLVEQMMKLPVMRAIFDRLRAINKPGDIERGMNREKVSMIIEEVSRFSGTTPYRRASSVIAWFKWLGENTGLVTVKDGSLFLNSKRQMRLEEIGR